MQNFIFSVPTKVFFGKGSIQNLPGAVLPWGKKVLLVYGCGSIRRSGLYDEVTTILRENDIQWTELGGVLPNPRVLSVREGVRLSKKNKIELVLAVGGGSVADCAKAISVSRYYEGDAWDIMVDPCLIKKKLPVCVVTTLSAAGSEFNGNFVISNPDTNEKIGIWHQSAFPVSAVMDPRYTYSVSAYLTAAGTADIFSHALEGYFNAERASYITDCLSEGVMKTCIRYGKKSLEHPDDYEARSNLMWASSLGMTGLTRHGRKSFITSCHPIEHQLSAYYDVNHGMGMGVLIPTWMEYVLNDNTAYRFAQYGRNVFGLTGDVSDMQMARLAIGCTRTFLEELNIPTTLTELGIEDETYFEVMAKKAVALGLNKAFVPLGEKDVINILRMCMK